MQIIWTDENYVYPLQEMLDRMIENLFSFSYLNTRDLFYIIYCLLRFDLNSDENMLVCLRDVTRTIDAESEMRIQPAGSSFSEGRITTVFNYILRVLFCVYHGHENSLSPAINSSFNMMHRSRNNSRDRRYFALGDCNNVNNVFPYNKEYLLSDMTDKLNEAC
jgi:hypothetical protein